MQTEMSFSALQIHTQITRENLHMAADVKAGHKEGEKEHS